MVAQFDGLQIKRTQALVFDAILAVHLLDHQLAVAMDDQLAAAQLQGMLQCLDETGILGDVVGGLAEVTFLFDIGFAVAFDNISVRGGARIAARPAIGKYRPCACIAHAEIVLTGVKNPMQPHFLILETSHRLGKVALAEGDFVVGQRTLDESRRHARDLAPATQELLQEQGWRRTIWTASS